MASTHGGSGHILGNIRHKACQMKHTYMLIMLEDPCWRIVEGILLMHQYVHTSDEHIRYACLDSARGFPQRSGACPLMMFVKTCIQITMLVSYTLHGFTIGNLDAQMVCETLACVMSTIFSESTLF
jgi:hypothetical protein